MPAAVSRTAVIEYAKVDVEGIMDSLFFRSLPAFWVNEQISVSFCREKGYTKKDIKMNTGLIN